MPGDSYDVGIGMMAFHSKQQLERVGRDREGLQSYVFESSRKEKASQRVRQWEYLMVWRKFNSAVGKGKKNILETLIDNQSTLGVKSICYLFQERIQQECRTLINQSIKAMREARRRHEDSATLFCERISAGSVDLTIDRTKARRVSRWFDSQNMFWQKEKKMKWNSFHSIAMRTVRKGKATLPSLLETLHQLKTGLLNFSNLRSLRRHQLLVISMYVGIEIESTKQRAASVACSEDSS